jgi:hypothetical protein
MLKILYLFGAFSTLNLLASSPKDPSYCDFHLLLDRIAKLDLIADNFNLLPKHRKFLLENVNFGGEFNISGYTSEISLNEHFVKHGEAIAKKYNKSPFTRNDFRGSAASFAKNSDDTNIYYKDSLGQILKFNLKTHEFISLRKGSSYYKNSYEVITHFIIEEVYGGYRRENILVHFLENHQ